MRTPTPPSVAAGTSPPLSSSTTTTAPAPARSAFSRLDPEEARAAHRERDLALAEAGEVGALAAVADAPGASRRAAGAGVGDHAELLTTLQGTAAHADAGRALVVERKADSLRANSPAGGRAGARSRRRPRRGRRRCRRPGCRPTRRRSAAARAGGRRASRAGGGACAARAVAARDEPALPSSSVPESQPLRRRQEQHRQSGGEGRSTHRKLAAVRPPRLRRSPTGTLRSSLAETIRSTSPYSTASSAPKKRSRSMSSWTSSWLLFVWRA